MRSLLCTLFTVCLVLPCVLADDTDRSAVRIPARRPPPPNRTSYAELALPAAACTLSAVSAYFLLTALLPIAATAPPQAPNGGPITEGLEPVQQSAGFDTIEADTDTDPEPNYVPSLPKRRQLQLIDLPSGEYPIGIQYFQYREGVSIKSIQFLNSGWDGGDRVRTVNIIRGDIFNAKADVLANPAANEQLTKGDGLCKEIYQRAGSDQLEAECQRYYPTGCNVGEAVFNSPFGLSRYGFKHLIQTVGPNFREMRYDAEEGKEAFYQTYRSIISFSEEIKARSVTIPLTCGNGGDPAMCARIAIQYAIEWLDYLSSDDSLTKRINLVIDSNLASDDLWNACVAYFNLVKQHNPSQ